MEGEFERRAMTTYRVTISAGDGGSVSPDGEIEVAAATDVWIYAAPQQGNKVAQWYHDGQPWGCDVTSYVIRGIARDANVHVTFMPVVHGVTTTPCDGGESSQGTVSPRSSLDAGPIRVDHGASVTFTAAPAPGYRVHAWTVDGQQVAGAVETYTLPSVGADHAVAVSFDLPPLAPLRWRGTVTLSWNLRIAPGSRNTTRTADTVITQADLDASGLPGPVGVAKGGFERHRDVRTERVKAVLRVGPADPDGNVGTIDLRRHDLVQHLRSQQVSAGTPARRRRVTHTHTVESYPLSSRRGVHPVAEQASAEQASVSVAYDAGQWHLAVRLAPPEVDGERREHTFWTVTGTDRPRPEPIITSTQLTADTFEQRIGTGVTSRDATRLKGRRAAPAPGQATVAWDLRLDSR